MDKNKSIHRGIEVEYWVVDDNGELTEPGELVYASDGVEREFVEPLIEIKTTPCETSNELYDQLLGRLDAVLRKADELGKGLVPLGTPLNSREIREIPSTRNSIQNGVIGDRFRYTRYCAGTHFHFEQEPGCEVDQLNTLIALDPALALVNSSPYHDGKRTVAGARSELYRWKAYEDVSHQGRLWQYTDSTDEWKRRLERRYDEFIAAASDAGFDRRSVVANFEPESSVWTPVQIRDGFGTVEWRSPDTALPSQVLRLADDIARTVWMACEHGVRIEGMMGGLGDETVTIPEFDAVLVYLKDAIRKGLKSDAITSYLDRMGFSIGDYSPISHSIDHHRTITRKKARYIRLEYAQLLKDDVRRTKRITSD